MTDQYRCNLCGASGNSVTLYARLKNVSNKEAYRELSWEGRLYPMPARPECQVKEREPKPLLERSRVYEQMLSHLVLLDNHRDNLLERGLSGERIEQNGYKSMPESGEARRLLAGLLMSEGFNLKGIPGFYTRDGRWTLAGSGGFLIPVRDRDGLIQGLKIRLDGENQASRKYRWMSSRDNHLENGARSYSWVHVTGDRTRKQAFITEGPLKGDVASYLAGDALFICTGGVNAIHGLRETVESLGVTELVEAMDMDQMQNPQVRNAVLRMRRELQSIPGIRYSKYTWNPAYKGVDDYFLSLAAAV